MSERKVGVLALQGSFAPHAKALARIGQDPILVKKPEHFEGLTHLVLPGGESTTFRWLLDQFQMIPPLHQAYERGLQIMATCAGSILISRPDEERPPRFGWLDVHVTRNAYGRQVDSFATELAIPCLGENPFHSIFIRAPQFSDVGEGVEILATHQGTPVAVSQGRILALTFHPELTDDSRFHQYFLDRESFASNDIVPASESRTS